MRQTKFRSLRCSNVAEAHPSKDSVSALSKLVLLRSSSSVNRFWRTVAQNDGLVEYVHIKLKIVSISFGSGFGAEIVF